MNQEKRNIKRLFLEPNGDLKWWLLIVAAVWFLFLTVLLVIEIVF